MDTEEKVEQRRKEAAKLKKRNQRREKSKVTPRAKHILIGIGVVIAAAAIAFVLIFPNTGLSRRVMTAFTVGDEKVSVAEYSYYYRSAYSSYYNMMVQYVGEENVSIDRSQSLTKQKMSDGTTYADYFSKQAIDNLTKMIVLSSEAEKADFKISDDDQKQYDELIDNIKTAAKSAHVSINSYLGSSYGLGFNLDMFKKCLKRELLADAWQDHITNDKEYTDDEYESYYQDHKDTIDTVDIRVEQFAVKDASSEDSSSAEDSSSEAVTIAECEADANAFYDQVTDEQSFSDLALARAKEIDGEDAKDETLSKNQTLTGLGYIDTDLASWAFDASRKAGDKTVLENANKTAYYVAYIVRPRGREETKVVNFRQILITTSSDDDQAAIDKKEETAQILYDKWQEEGGSEESFEAYAVSNSEDTNSAKNGGLYENAYPGQMVTPIDDWLFDPSRKAGDSGIVQSSYGFHLLYYVGQGDAKWKVDVESDMRTDDYNEYYDGVSKDYTVKENKLFMRYRSEPI